MILPSKRLIVLILCPMTSGQLREWLHEQPILPYLEGTERLKRAWHGVDFHCIYNTKLSFKERVISLLVGLILLFPLFNMLVWKGMETFGHPEFLSPFPAFEKGAGHFSVPPLSVQTEAPPDIEIEVEDPSSLPTTTPVDENSEVRVEHIRYHEITGDTTIDARWVFTHGPEGLTAVKSCSQNFQTARFGLDGNMRDLHFKTTDEENEVFAKLAGKTVTIWGKKGGKEFASKEKPKEYEIPPPPDDFPFIQHVTLGFIKFIQTRGENFLNFYGINPFNYKLLHLTAEKTKLEKVPELEGELQKVEIRIANILARYLWKAEIWFDPKTGILKKMVANSGPFTAVTTTLFVP